MMDKILYQLDCGHTVLQPARLVNTTLICNLCREKRLVNGIVIYEWRAKCYSCNYARWSGLVKSVANEKARSHARSKPTHDVKAEYAKNPIAEASAEKFKKVHGIRA